MVTKKTKKNNLRKRRVPFSLPSPKKISITAKTHAQRVAKKKTLVRILFLGIIILLLFLGFLIYSSMNNSKPQKELFISVTDECSPWGGSLLHPISNEGDCRIRCVNECDVRKRDVGTVTFSLGNNSCNSCGCSCI